VAESLHEQLVAAFQANLAGIVGDGGANYWFTPDRVVRVPAFSEACLDSSLTTIYCISPGQVEDALAHSTVGVRAVLTLDLAIVTRYTPSEEINPFTADVPLRWTIQTRLERDAKKKIRSFYHLGFESNAVWVEIPITEYVADQTFFQGWAAVFMRCLVHFIYADVAP
jgi:hypothetical protein